MFLFIFALQSQLPMTQPQLSGLLKWCIKRIPKHKTCERFMFLIELCDRIKTENQWTSIKEPYEGRWEAEIITPEYKIYVTNSRLLTVTIHDPNNVLRPL